MQEQASLLSSHVTAGATRALEPRVAAALEAVLGRPATPEQVERGVDLVHDLQASHGFTADAAFDSFSLLLLNLNEFVYLD